jgi:hypothetical protein
MPSLAFSPRIVEAHEPMRVQTFRSKFAIDPHSPDNALSFGAACAIQI